MKQLFICRHCKAYGQSSDSPLTDEGLKQAKHLALFLSNFEIDRIISSPYVRAIESVKPFAEKTDRTIEIDERLSERILSTTDLNTGELPWTINKLLRRYKYQI